MIIGLINNNRFSFNFATFSLYDFNLLILYEVWIMISLIR